MNKVITGKEEQGTEIINNGFKFWVNEADKDGNLVISNERNHRVILSKADFRFARLA